MQRSLSLDELVHRHRVEKSARIVLSTDIRETMNYRTSTNISHHAPLVDRDNFLNKLTVSK